MLQITTQFKKKVISALLDVRTNYDGSDSAFAKKWGINGSVYSRLKSGEIDGLLKDNQYLNIGRELNVSSNDRKWNMARTDVFTIIEEDITFCQTYSKAKICVDDCGIGKTFSAKYLARTLKNCFYVDASQAKTKQLFVRLLAKTIGIDHNGKYSEVFDNIKYYLRMLPTPMVIIDEAGKLNKDSFEEIQSLWNATEGACGWYMMGANGFRRKIQKGLERDKEGYAEIFSRYSESFTVTVPQGRDDKINFYRKLITDVLSVNMKDQSQLQTIVKRCLTSDSNGRIGGLRRAESLLILNS